MSTPPSIDYASLIDHLERRDLDRNPYIDLTPFFGRLHKVPFLRVRGLSAFWQSNDSPDLLSCLDDVLSGLVGLGHPLQFVLMGEEGNTSFYVGLEGSNGEPLLRDVLTGIFPGILLGAETQPNLGTYLNQGRFLSWQGVVTGIPTRKSGTNPREIDTASREDWAFSADNVRNQGRGHQVERLIRGLQGERWGIWLVATPLQHSELLKQSRDLLNLIAHVASQTKRQYQQVTQQMIEVRQGQSEGTTTSFSDEIVNRQAEQAVRLLERQAQRYQLAKATGMWRVESRFFAQREEALVRLAALIRATWNGSESIPDSIRTFVCQPNASAQPLASDLTTPELAILMQMPKEEFQGFRIAPYARYDTDPPEPAAEPVALGHIINGNRRTVTVLNIEAAKLATHTLVAGMTGSGKTTTVFNLLRQLTARGVPYLVIEPAKSEYRSLLAQNSKGKPGEKPAMPRVYTLGDETVAPFRLNPFEFEIVDSANRIYVQTHIDYLKAVFNAAFVLYAPMTYVLDMCLHEIYTDCGWDLSTGLNIRLSEKEYDSDLPVFPTLSDLHEKIDDVVNRLGYEERIVMDVTAGLKARVASLMLGSKGLMLNCARGVPLGEVLGNPTVLELERIGNDDEKAFVMGLLLARIYEFRRLHAQREGHSKFRHLMIVEEAHRLLKNVPTDVPVEGSNTRGQAVETFTNILSEIRSFGQGILVAEQIPTKLAPDVVKNTNLKLVHRLVSAEEREVVAGAMNMTDEQAKYLSVLEPGQCVAYMEGADYPYLLKVPPVPQNMAATVTDAALRSLTSQLDRPLYEPIRGYRNLVHSGQRVVPSYRHQVALQVFQYPSFKEVWASLLLRVVMNPSALAAKSLNDLIRVVQAVSGDMNQSNTQIVVRTVILLAVDRTLRHRGRLYRWPYSVQVILQDRLSTGLIALIDNKPEAVDHLSQFTVTFRKVTSMPVGPYIGCLPCRVKCWIRADIAVPASQPHFRHDVIQAVSSGNSRKEIGNELGLIAVDSVEHMVPEAPREVHTDLAICFLSQLLAHTGFTARTQSVLVQEVAAELRTH